MTKDASHSIELPAFIDIFSFPDDVDEELDANASMSAEEFKKEVCKRIGKLHEIGLNLIEPGQIVEFKTISGKKIVAGVKPIDNWQYEFVIAEAALRRSKAKYLDTIIYHELCHILQINYSQNTGALFFLNDEMRAAEGKDEFLRYAYELNRGHTWLWQSFADKVNQRLRPEPQVSQLLDDDSLHDLLENGRSDDR